MRGQRDRDSEGDGDRERGSQRARRRPGGREAGTKTGGWRRRDKRDRATEGAMDTQGRDRQMEAQRHRGDRDRDAERGCRARDAGSNGASQTGRGEPGEEQSWGGHLRGRGNRGEEPQWLVVSLQHPERGDHVHGPWYWSGEDPGIGDPQRGAQPSSPPMAAALPRPVLSHCHLPYPPLGVPARDGDALLPLSTNRGSPHFVIPNPR